ncbi:hypothetical protein SUGI_0373420 [Cryptomeria japonica]|nr:hypothetical protein SUGI_0373420 [Cryptomeria japonica]
MAAHVLVIPYPGRGHLNPMMHLALKLASHRISIAFVLTESWHKIITQVDEDPFTRASNLRAALIPNCVVGESQRARNFAEFLCSPTNMEVHVPQLKIHGGGMEVWVRDKKYRRWE